MRYCESPFLYRRRRTREVVVGDPARGGVILGGEHPVVMQSMLTCDTMNTAECVKQTLDLVAVGCQLVRITAPTVKDAANLRNIVAELRARDCLAPIVADIHFKPEAAMEAAKWVEMVRINPGNYADSKKFAIKEYTDEQYAAELKRIEEKFTPLVTLCKELKRALRIGTNHGSLSDRIMNRFGDTPLGMVEIEVCRDLLAQIPKLTTSDFRLQTSDFAFDPFHFERRVTPEIELNEQTKCGGEQLIRVVVTRATWDKVAPKIRPKDDVKPEAVYEDLNVAELDPTQDFDINCDTQLVTVKDGSNLPAITAFRLLAAKLKRLGRNNPILLKDCLVFDERRTGVAPVSNLSGSQKGNMETGATPVLLEPKIALLR